MRLIRRIARVMAVVVLTAAAVEAAPVTIRTAPVGPLTGGFARCAAVNGGTQAGSVTMTLFSDDIDAAGVGVLLARDTETLAANDSTFGTVITVVVNTVASPTWCECTVPNKTSFRCSLTHVNGDNVTVVPAE